MSTIASDLFMSLDGVVEADDDWQFPYFDEELFTRIAAAWHRADKVLLGRRTYEGYERLRVEHPDSPMIAFLDATSTYVVSSTLRPGAERGVTVIDSRPRDEIAELRRSGRTLVLGSPSLVRWLLLEQLLDELNVIMLPIVVGGGPRLFENMPDHRVPLQLARSTSLGSGALDLSYVPTES